MFLQGVKGSFHEVAWQKSSFLFKLCRKSVSAASLVIYLVHVLYQMLFSEHSTIITSFSYKFIIALV
jgi:hypothetical protein